MHCRATIRSACNQLISHHNPPRSDELWPWQLGINRCNLLQGIATFACRGFPIHITRTVAFLQENHSILTTNSAQTFRRIRPDKRKQSRGFLRPRNRGESAGRIAASSCRLTKQAALRNLFPTLRTARAKNSPHGAIFARPACRRHGSGRWPKRQKDPVGVPLSKKW